jgi:hypothetical protein
MSGYVPNIIGYHTNNSERCFSFMEEKGDDAKIIIGFDETWLGEGMYFWDNLSNAKYWARQKLRKHQEIKTVSIVKGHVILDALLDLTDNDILTTIDKLWLSYCSKHKNINKYSPLGIKINTLFRVYKSLNQKYDSIKVFGFYPSIKESYFFPLGKKETSPRAVNDIRTIYCVRNAEKIVDKKFEQKEIRR